MLKSGKSIFQDRDARGRMQPLMDSVGFGSQSGSGVNGSDGHNLSAGSSTLDRRDRNSQSPPGSVPGAGDAAKNRRPGWRCV